MKFKSYKTKPNQYTEWISPNPKAYQMACCDCGLVHTVQFKVIFRVKRNNKLTKQLRSEKKCQKTGNKKN